MNRSQYLSNRLKEVLLDGTWIANTNFKAQIISLDFENSIKKVSNLNSVALLVFHINYYIKGILDFYETNQLTISDKYSCDMPEIASQNDWDNLVNQFLLNSEQLIQKIGVLDDVTLDTVFAKAEYGSQIRNIDGLIEHCYYHLGQISLLIKMLKN